MLRNLVILAVAVGLVSDVEAAVPAHVPVQGTLRDNAGQPVLEGAYAMRVSLYASEDAAEPVHVVQWPSDPAADCLVDPTGCVVVHAGTFRVEVPVAPEIFAGGVVWLGLSVEGEPELPRRRLGTTPYAFHAAAAAGLACSGCVTIDAMSEDAVSTIVAAAAAAFSLAPDTLDDVSNGLLTNEFVDVFTHPGVIAIPDNYPPGLEVSLTVDDVGIAAALSVHITLENSDIATLALLLTDPAGTSHVLYDKGGVGDALDATWPSPDVADAGALTEWIGQNPAGVWTLQVVDSGFLNNLQDGQITEWSITVDTLSTKKVQANADLIVTGSVQVGGSDAPCDASGAGSVIFHASTKTLRVCDGENWLRLRTCDPACPAASTVTCGEAIVSACGDSCGEEGTKTDAAACLQNISVTPCGEPVTDACDNACGLGGTAPNAAACLGPAEVDCGQDITDSCGNACPGQGEDCAVGACLSGACCGDESIDGSEQCDDGNQVDGDGCSAQCQNEGVTYRGYIVWSQDCYSQSDANQDTVMNNACQSSYGDNARAATVEEIYSGEIEGLPGNNSSGEHLLGVCPDCAGGNGGCVSGHCRKCVDPGAGWPTSSDSGWNTNCCNSSRSAICVD